MVSYYEQHQRDSHHDRFIGGLNRNQAARLFESHVLDIIDAAQRCAARTLDSQAFLILLRHKIETLNYYVPGGPLDRALAGRRRVTIDELKDRCREAEDALDSAIDAFIEIHSDDDDAAAESGATPDPAPPESDGSATTKPDFSARKSESGTEIAITNS